MSPRTVRFTVIAIFAFISAACGGSGASDQMDSSSLTIFGAASLSDALVALGDGFGEEHPEVELVFNFDGSSTLVTQIIEGAPADVFASADLSNMQRLVAADGVLDEPLTFTTNRSEIIVEAGNPLDIQGPADLAREDVVVVLCAVEVPCGRYAAEIFEGLDLEIEPASYERNVKAVVTKVVLGEADAGIVYATDVLAAGDDVSGVPIPSADNVTAEYPIAVTADASNPVGGRDFIEFVMGERGQSILESFGFERP